MNTSKKLVLQATATVIMGLALVTPVLANDINVTVDGEVVNFAGQQPAIIDGRTLVPVRGVFETLGFEVEWNAELEEIVLTRTIPDLFTVIGPNGSVEGLIPSPEALPAFLTEQAERLAFTEFDLDNMLSMVSPQPSQTRLVIPMGNEGFIHFDNDSGVVPFGSFGYMPVYAWATMAHTTEAFPSYIHEFDVPAQLINGSTMLPIRALVEVLGYTLDWDGTTSTIVITTN